jgi:hypothetical protein
LAIFELMLYSNLFPGCRPLAERGTHLSEVAHSDGVVRVRGRPRRQQRALSARLPPIRVGDVLQHWLRAPIVLTLGCTFLHLLSHDEEGAAVCQTVYR